MDLDYGLASVTISGGIRSDWKYFAFVASRAGASLSSDDDQKNKNFKILKKYSRKQWYGRIRSLSGTIQKIADHRRGCLN